MLSLTTTPINTTSNNSISMVHYNELVSRDTWRWTDSKANTSKIGDYFAFRFHGKYMRFHKIIDIMDATYRLVSWGADDGKHVLILSRQLKEMSWSEWESLNGPNQITKTATFKNLQKWPLFYQNLLSFENNQPKTIGKITATVVNKTHVSEATKEATKETVSEATKESTMETVSEATRETVSEAAKETVSEATRETAKERLERKKAEIAEQERIAAEELHQLEIDVMTEEFDEIKPYMTALYNTELTDIDLEFDKIKQRYDIEREKINSKLNILKLSKYTEIEESGIKEIIAEYKTQNDV